MKYWNQLNRIIWIIGIFILVITASCSDNSHRSGEEPLARAYNAYLYPSDIARIVPSGLANSDSLAFVKNYRDQWIKRQLMLEIAEFNLDRERFDFTEMINDYRASLYIHEYQKQFLAEKVDTMVNEDQIERYYNQNLSDFVLSGPLIKALYIRILKDNSKIAEIKKLLQSTSDSAFQNLVTLCYQYADRFDFFNDQWVSFGLVVQNIPGSPENHEEFLRSKALMEITDQEYVHFLQVHDYKLANETAPIEYVYDKIIDLVLTERRMDFLKKLEESIYQNAIEKNDFELFEEK